MEECMMNTWIKRLCRLSILLLICLLPGFFSGASAESFMLYVGPSAEMTENSDKAIPLDSVRLYKRDGKWYLFLPAGWDSNELSVYFTGTDSVTVAGEQMEYGAVTDVFKHGAKVKVKPQRGGEMLVNVMQSQNLPAIFIRTESGNVDAISGDKTIREPGSMFMLMADGKVEYNGKLEYIKARGNSTFFYAKKPWQIKLEDGTALCGMDKEKKWILLANFLDKSLIRNSIYLDMARATGVYAYVPEYHPVDLYINNAYWGSYLLTEKNEVDGDRLDITDLEKATENMNDTPLEELPTFGQKLYSLNGAKGTQVPNEPEDVTGGYLLQANSRVYFANDPSGFVTSRGQAFTIHSPEHASQAQVQYTQKLIQSVENALFAADGIDPDSGRHYTEMLDFTTFVYRYVQAEVTADFDGQRPFFYKDRDRIDPVLYCAPVWDGDNIFGAAATHSSARRFYICNDQSQKYYWFVQAMKRPEFKEEAIRVYQDVFSPMMRVLLGQETNPEGILRSIDEYADEIAASAEMDNIRWPIAMLRHDSFNPSTGSTPAKNVEYVKKYVQRRLEFLNSQWGE